MRLGRHVIEQRIEWIRCWFLDRDRRLFRIWPLQARQHHCVASIAVQNMAFQAFGPLLWRLKQTFLCNDPLVYIKMLKDTASDVPCHALTQSNTALMVMMVVILPGGTTETGDLANVAVDV
jgi:hypothetical protein